jgi:hypothetical protein
MVPVFAGRLAVTVPNAPATGWSFTVPEVALPKVADPRVPLNPNVSAPFVSVDTVTVVQPPAPLATRRSVALPPVLQPVPPLAAAHVGFALAPWVCKNSPDDPGASTVQTVELR